MSFTQQSDVFERYHVAKSFVIWTNAFCLEPDDYLKMSQYFRRILVW